MDVIRLLEVVYEIGENINFVHMRTYSLTQYFERTRDAPKLEDFDISQRQRFKSKLTQFVNAFVKIVKENEMVKWMLQVLFG